mmetsp:Transcript_37130/g.100237  ORF Transcript_37130/g.100237 Transcript_37130/m.100237 type:complete len:155 (+) Transcript_37130:817-1281(+)
MCVPDKHISLAELLRLVGPATPVSVLDVEQQCAGPRDWTMQRWVSVGNACENLDPRQSPNPKLNPNSTSTFNVRWVDYVNSFENYTENDEDFPPLLHLARIDVSETGLGRLIKPPTFVTEVRARRACVVSCGAMWWQRYTQGYTSTKRDSHPNF